MTPDRIERLLHYYVGNERVTPAEIRELAATIAAQQREIDGLYGLLIQEYAGFGPDTPPGGRSGWIVNLRPGHYGTVYDTREQAVVAVKKAMEEKR